MFEKISFSEKQNQDTLGANLIAPMSGKIAEVKVIKGDTVNKGDVLLVLESMKMYQELMAQQDGLVTGVYIKPNQQVEVNMPLIDIVTSEQANDE